VIINNLNFLRAVRRGRPFKTDTPLCIDPDAVLPFSVPGEGFQSVAAKLGQVGSPVAASNTRSRFSACGLKGSNCGTRPPSANRCVFLSL